MRAEVVPPHANAMPSNAVNTVPPPSAPRAGTGPHRWAGGVSRFKRVVGGGLRSRTGRRRATEAAIAVGAPKRMLDLERPEYVRTA